MKQRGSSGLIRTLSVVVFIGATPQCAYSKTLKTNFCNPMYEKVERIYIHIHGSLPVNTTEEWTGILNETTRYHAEKLREEGIQLVITEEPSWNVLSKDEGSLYVDTVLSYVKGSSFSVPIKDNYVASWSKVSRNVKGKERFEATSSPPSFVRSPSGPESLKSPVAVSFGETFHWSAPYK